MDTFFNYYNKRSKETLIEMLRAMMRQDNEISDILADILGYPRGDGSENDPSGGGYIIGDHTALSLLDELKEKLTHVNVDQKP